MKSKVVKYNNGIAIVEYAPNLIQKIFRIKAKTYFFRWTGERNWIDDCMIYSDVNSRIVYGRFTKIDEFIKNNYDVL